MSVSSSSLDEDFMIASPNSEEIGYSNQTLKKWKSYELSSNEFPVFPWIPRYYFMIRNAIFNPFDRHFFLLWGTKITLGGIILGLGFLCFCLYWSYIKRSTIKGMGRLATYFLALTYSLGSHSSLWGLILGSSFDRGLPFHKFFGLISVVIGAIHSKSSLLYKQKSWKISTYTGIALWLVMMFQCVNSFFPFRKNYYKYFYILHILSGICIVVLTVLHNSKPAYIGFGLWGLDWVCKIGLILFNKFRVKEVTLTKVSSTVVQFSFPNPNNRFKFLPGQFCFISIPELGCFEKAHPFSIASAPQQSRVSFYIREETRYTRKILELSMKKSKIQANVEGPYGNYSINAEGDRYKSFVFVSGGIGVTPLKSISQSLLYDKVRGRPVSNILFIWCVRDYSLISAVFGEEDDLLPNLTSIKDETFSDQVLDFRVFLTSKQVFENLPQKISKGRPDLETILTVFGEKVKESGEKRVAVFSSGPEELVTSSVRMSKQAAKKTKIAFDIHTESFNF